MVVNGTTWPVYNVAAAKYRLRLLNGCNARTLILKMVDQDSLNDLQAAFDDGGITKNDLASPALQFWQIGSDGGLLPGKAVQSEYTSHDAGGTCRCHCRLFEPVEWGRALYNQRGTGRTFWWWRTGRDFDVSNPYTTGMVMKFVVDGQLTGDSPTDSTASNPARLIFCSH